MLGSTGSKSFVGVQWPYLKKVFFFLMVLKCVFFACSCFFYGISGLVLSYGGLSNWSGCCSFPMVLGSTDVPASDDLFG